MLRHKLGPRQIQAYASFLQAEEKSAATTEKYLRDIGAFCCWLEGQDVTREAAAGWKAHLVEQGYAPVTVNAMLSAINGLFGFLGWNECRVKLLKIQRRLFRDSGRELSRGEYERLLVSAREQGRDRLALLMETICSTGIRVSEVRYITAEAVRQGRAEIALKGKIRVILLPGKLCRKLQAYANKLHARYCTTKDENQRMW